MITRPKNLRFPTSPHGAWDIPLTEISVQDALLRDGALAALVGLPIYEEHEYIGRIVEAQLSGSAEKVRIVVEFLVYYEPEDVRSHEDDEDEPGE